MLSYLFAVAGLLTASSWAQTATATQSPVYDPADLNQDGVVDVADAQLAINRSIGRKPCARAVDGEEACNPDVVQQVIQAALAHPLIAGIAVARSVSLNWTASTSPDVIGYNVYRSQTSGGPYSKRNAGPVVATFHGDRKVVSGQTYFYVLKAIDSTNKLSAYSNEATIKVP